MAYSKTWASLFLSLNLLLIFLFFFDVVSSCGGGSCPCPTPRPPRPTPTPNPPSSKGKKCPTDALKLGVCANVLNGLINLKIGTPPKEPCCSLIQGLADLEAAVCLCTVLRANVLGIINLNLPINLTLLLNYCGKGVPSGFICP